MISAYDAGMLNDKKLIIDLVAGMGDSILHGGARKHHPSEHENSFYGLLLAYGGGPLLFKLVSANLGGMNPATAKRHRAAAPKLADYAGDRKGKCTLVLGEIRQEKLAQTGINLR